jgi:hypothetical protein
VSALSDLSIVIPFKYDSPDRLANLETVISYFRVFFTDIDLIILEVGDAPYFKPREENQDIQYRFILLSPGTFLHRTALLNQGAKQSKRPYVTLYDTDVIFPPQAILDTVSYLRTHPEAVFGSPYQGICWEVQGEAKNQFIQTFDFSSVPMDISPKVGVCINDFTCIHTQSLGGATFFRRAPFLMAGGYNERFISWGWEDNEIVTRFSKLGFPPFRISNPYCIHLSHPRTIDSQGTHPFFKTNYQEYKRVKRMNPIQLCGYIQTKLGGTLSEALIQDIQDQYNRLSIWQKIKQAYLAFF